MRLFNAFLSPFLALVILPSFFLSQGGKDGSADKNVNPMVTALEFTHRYALPKVLAPGKDRDIKAKWLAALSGNPPTAAREAVEDLFDKPTFRKLAGGVDRIDVRSMERAVQDGIPQSRKDMHAKPRLHADLLSTQFDMIEAKHHPAGEEFVSWIVKNHRADKPVSVIIICTGNTRRSMLAATMGNIAAAYHGLPEIRFYSGGTEPSAFNPRTIATLKEIGVEIEPTGKEAPRGISGEANPIYAVRWGKGLETVEYSKKYTDSQNPRDRFAALLVCGEAESACPQVEGAGIRLPVPYFDPKAYDGAPFESAKYAERRDDIGRFMLNALLQARRQLEAAPKP